MESYGQHPYTHGDIALVFPTTVPIGRAGAVLTARPVTLAQTEAAVVKTYTPAVGTPAHPSYTVTVDGLNSHVYAHPASTIPMGVFTYFDFSGSSVTVTITTNVDVTTAVLRPLNLGITPEIVSARVVTVVLDPISVPANMSFEINGDLTNPLFIFAGTIETYPPATDPNVQFRYLEGVTYSRPATGSLNGISALGDLVVGTGKTIVIEGGAIVKARVRMGVPNASTAGVAVNCRILGRGIVDAANVPFTQTVGSNQFGPPMRAYKVNGSEINGPIFVGRGKWAFRIFGCRTSGTVDGASLRVTNVKVINGQVAAVPSLNEGEGTPDGMDVIASTNVEIDGAFIRSIDDGFVVKNSKNDMNGNWSGTVHNVVFRNGTIWQGPAGNALSLGWEMGRRDVKGSTIINTTDRVHFINCDVIHKTAKDIHNFRGAMAIHNMDGWDTPLSAGHVPYSPITNILFEDIRVEHCQQTYVYLYNAHSGDTGDTITFRNCTILDTQNLPSVIRGVTGGLFTNVLFENFKINGTAITSAGAGLFTITNAPSVTFTGQTGGDDFLGPVADAWVQNGGAAPQQAGTTTRLFVKGSVSTPVQKKAYLRFNLAPTGLPSCTAAVLRMYCTSMDDALVVVPVTCYEVTTGGDSFTEAITWGTAPTLGSTIVTTNVTSDLAYYQWDVTAYVNTKLGGTDLVAFALYDPSVANNKIQFASRESPTNQPQLILTA